MATMKKNEKFQLELLRRLMAHKQVFTANESDFPTGWFQDVYGWDTVFRVVDMNEFFLCRDANLYKQVEIPAAHMAYYSAIRDESKTHEIKAGRGKKTIVAFTDKELGITAYVDAKNLEYFEDDATFFVRSPYDPVFVTEGDEFAGFIMPFITDK